LVLCLISVLAVSCAPALWDEMGRFRDNPQVCPPRVVSFAEPGSIILCWDKDDCADEYILLRALDQDRQYSEVYRGTGLVYKDENVSVETRYLYALYKVRGSREFGPSLSVMGIGSFIQEDPCEDNDTRETAFPFTNNLLANTFGYKSIGHEYSLVDRDFYSLVVRPHMTATYSVNVMGVSGNDPTGLEYQITYREPADVVDMGGIGFENNSSYSVTFIFSISPKDSEISQNAAEGGGRVFTYELNYIGETPSGGG
jgi:hypothetical protein